MSDGTCRSCGARILWRKSILTGKPIPIDPRPVDHGNIRLTEQTCIVLNKANIEQANRAGENLYQSHFATCPDANDHRKSA